ncbi:hypothetical protein JKY72_01255 [Candidatus Gracilibacteria bacterium]|nr:hypothetical protein [Candidatus Gracilibacteria bacterium]
MNTPDPSRIDEFVAGYTNAQAPYGTIQLQSHRANDIENSYNEAHVQVPAVDFKAEAFSSEMMPMIADMQKLMADNKSFIIIKPDDLSPGSGWKTFLIALAKNARTTKHKLLNTGNAGTNVSSFDGNYYQKDHLYALPVGEQDEDDLPPQMERVPNELVQIGRIKRLIEEDNFDTKKTPYVLVTTAAELAELESSGHVSKIKRLSTNGTGDLPTFHYPSIDWSQIIQNRINSTDVDLNWLTITGDHPRACQESQQPAVKEFLQRLLHTVSARITTVLQGKYGVGKSVLISNAKNLIELLQERDLLSDLILERVPSHRFHSNHTDLMFTDDKFGEQGSGSTDLYDQYLERKGLIAASNAPTEDIRNHIRQSSKERFLSARKDDKDHTMKHPAFVNSSVITLPGADYSN